MRERLKDYYRMELDLQNGEVFTQYPVTSQDLSISVNAHALARYVALVQEAGMVPIIGQKF